MNKEMKIYVVTSGEYSDYSIDAVFTDKAMAEKYADEGDAFYGCDRRIEEFNANECGFRTEGVWREVFVPATGNDEDIKVNSKDYSYDTVEAVFQSDKKVCGYKFTVKAISKSKAKAIALERYHAMLAVKETHFPYLDCPVESTYNYRGIVHGYFDYKLYFIDYLDMFEFFRAVRDKLPNPIDKDIVNAACTRKDFFRLLVLGGIPMEKMLKWSDLFRKND